MLEKGKISVRQFAVLIFMCEVGDMILIYPAVTSAFSKQDGWISALLGIPLGLGILWIMLKLYEFYPKLNLVESTRRILGPWFGPVVSLCYLAFFLLAGATFIREVGDFMTTQLFENTPIRYINLLFVLILIWGLFQGLEPIARSAEIFLPVYLFFYAILFMCLLPEIDFARLKPLFGSGGSHIFHGTLLATAYPFGELCVFLMIMPYVTRQPHMRRDALLSAFSAGILLTAIVFLSLTVLGAFFTEHNIYASYILSQKINIGMFVQRIEALIASAWVISTYFKTILYFYAFVLGMAHIFYMRDYKPLIWPASFMLYGLSILIAPNILFYIKTIVPYWVDWDLTYSFVIPVMLIAVYYARKKLKL